MQSPHDSDNRALLSEPAAPAQGDAHSGYVHTASYVPTDRESETQVISTKPADRNIYDDPLRLIIQMGVLRVLFFVCSLQSTCLIIFLRNRIGLRMVRMWIIWTQVVFLLFLSGSALFFPGSAEFLNGGPLSLYALAVLILGWYRNGLAAEWVNDPKYPLHTMSRGSSWLFRLNLRLPAIPRPGMEFRKGRLCLKPFLPLTERAIQTVVEPVLVTMVAIFFSSIGWHGLALWLGCSAIALKITEHEYYAIGDSHVLDIADARVEAKRSRAMSDPDYARKVLEKDGKVGGLALAMPSEELLQRRAERQRQNLSSHLRR